MSSPKDRYILSVIRGIFYVLTAGAYHCIYELKYRLLPFMGCHDTLVCDSVFGETKGDSLSYIHNPILTPQCQRWKVSGTLRTTVTVFLRQQRDSLHRIHHSHSEECLRTATPTTSSPPSGCTPFSLAPSGSASRASATVVSSSPSKPPN